MPSSLSSFWLIRVLFRLDFNPNDLPLVMQRLKEEKIMRSSLDSAQIGWMVDYFITPNLILRLAQDYFFVPGFGGEVDESWGLGGLNRRRDETIIRLTYQF